MRKHYTNSYYLFDTEQMMIKELGERLPVSKSAIIRIAIHHLHREMCGENVENL